MRRFERIPTKCIVQKSSEGATFSKLVFNVVAKLSPGTVFGSLFKVIILITTLFSYT